MNVRLTNDDVKLMDVVQEHFANLKPLPIAMKPAKIVRMGLQMMVDTIHGAEGKAKRRPNSPPANRNRMRFDLAAMIRDDAFPDIDRVEQTLVSNLSASDLEYISLCIAIGSEGGDPTDAQRDAAFAFSQELRNLAG